MTMPARAAGSAVMMMKGIEPGLEIHDDEQVNEDDGEDEAAEEAGVRGAHGFELAADPDEAAARGARKCWRRRSD